MENLIKKEAELAKKYTLETEIIDSNIELVKLTQDNVAKVESNIKNDSVYNNCADVTKFPSKKYGGSSAYWISKIKPYIFQCEKNDFFYKQYVGEIVSAIDRENSTHLNADLVGRSEITNRIVNINKRDLLNYLMLPKSTNYKIIDIIKNKTSRGRENLSFATKFCHFMCIYLFAEDGKYQDNFSIYDNVLVKILPKYIKKYNINQNMFGDFKRNYKNYIAIIDEIRYRAEMESHELISRNGFDHLLWYFYKGK
jgi:hypothetical protein